MKSQESDYECCLNKLIELVKQINEAKTKHNWSPTPLKKNIESIAEKLEDIVGQLEKADSAQFAIETLHDERGAKDIIGIDGLPYASPVDWQSYKGIVWAIRDLGESSRLAAEELPNPRKKTALDYAALGLLHLRCDFGFGKPSIYDQSAEVSELKRICEGAGIYLSTSRLRGILKASLDIFDPNFREPEFNQIYK